MDVFSTTSSLGLTLGEFLNSSRLFRVIDLVTYCDIMMLNLIKIKLLGEKLGSLEGKLPPVPPPLDETLTVSIIIFILHTIFSRGYNMTLAVRAWCACTHVHSS